jgi:hypothetical protein
MSMTLRFHITGVPISMKQSILCLSKGFDGSSLIETALVMPVLLLMLLGSVDFGRAYYVAIEVNSAANAAALYGSQNPTDLSGMVDAANLDATDVPSLTTIPSYGCECYDGTRPPPPCPAVTANPCGTGNLLYYVQIKTTATYTPLLSYGSFPGPISLSGQATMRAAY